MFGPQHVMAAARCRRACRRSTSTANYWDGGLVSNTPLWYVLDDSRASTRWSAGRPVQRARREPRNLDEVLEREKDIRYSSKTRFNTTRVEGEETLRRRADARHRESCPRGCARIRRLRCWPSAREAQDLDRPPDQSPQRVFVAVEGLRVLARHSRELWAAGLRRHAHDGASRVAHACQQAAMQTYDLTAP